MSLLLCWCSSSWRSLCLRSSTIRSAGAVAATIAALAVAGWAAGSWTVHAAKLGSIFGGGVSFIRVQNVTWQPVGHYTPTPTAVATASVHVAMHDRQGRAVAFDQAGSVPGAAADVPPEADLARVFGLQSAVLRSNQPVAAVSGAYWPASGKFAEVTQAVPSTHVIVPIAVRRDTDTSYLAIQNSDPAHPAQIEVTWAAFGQFAGTSPLRRSIPAGQAILLDLESDPDLSARLRGFAGGMRVTADRPVAVYAWVDLKNSSKGMYAFEGIPVEHASDRLFIPLFRNDFYGTTTAIAFTNTQNGPVEVTLTYRGSPVSTAPDCRGELTIVHNGSPVQVKAGASVLFLQANIQSATGKSGLPGGCTGSATLDVAGGRGVAVVVNADERTAAAYTAVGREQGAKRIALPLFRNTQGKDALSTGIQAMNIGDSVAYFSLDVYLPDGTNVSGACGADCSHSIPPGGTYSLYPPSMTSQNSQRGTSGSAIIASTQPLAVLATDTSGIGTRDMAYYNGIPIDIVSAGPAADRFIPLVLGGAHGIYLPYVAFER